MQLIPTTVYLEDRPERTREQSVGVERAVLATTDLRRPKLTLNDPMKQEERMKHVVDLISQHTAYLMDSLWNLGVVRRCLSIAERLQDFTKIHILHPQPIIALDPLTHGGQRTAKREKRSPHTLHS